MMSEATPKQQTLSDIMTGLCFRMICNHGDCVETPADDIIHNWSRTTNDCTCRAVIESFNLNLFLENDITEKTVQKVYFNTSNDENLVRCWPSQRDVSYFISLKRDCLSYFGALEKQICSFCSTSSSGTCADADAAAARWRCPSC